MALALTCAEAVVLALATVSLDPVLALDLPVYRKVDLEASSSLTPVCGSRHKLFHPWGINAKSSLLSIPAIISDDHNSKSAIQIADRILLFKQLTGVWFKYNWLETLRPFAEQLLSKNGRT